MELSGPSSFVFAHIPGKGNYAADFLSRLQMDKGGSLSLKSTDKVPVREIYVESEAKSPDVSISNIDQLNNVPESEMKEVIIVSQLQELGLYDAYFERKRENGVEINSLFKLKRAEINTIQYAKHADVLNDLTDRKEILDLASEQTKDDEIMQAIEWKRNGLKRNLKYASRRLKNTGNSLTDWKLKTTHYADNSLMTQAK